MGYCGLKISGHSETDFKHKKAFANRNRLQKPEMKFVDVKIESREGNTSSNWYSYVKISIAITFSAMVLFIIYSFITRIDHVAFNRNYGSTEYAKSIKQIENSEAAIMLYNSAKQYYDSGALNYAQEEIILVLKIFPSNEDALQLMHKILDKQCKDKNIFCEEANDYKLYLKL